MKLLAAAVSLTSALFVPVLATGRYIQTANVVGPQFYNFFHFQAIDDPTHGRVTYVNEQTARSQNLTYATDNSFILRTDASTVIPAYGPGRNSVRLRSNLQYRTHVLVVDLRHIPQGCGTWPAVWETNEAAWPHQGEIDLVEGVNNLSPNKVTLHTNAGCVMPPNVEQTGTPSQLDCNVDVNYNAGCGVKMNEGPSYGPQFNGDGGGWYALERTDTFIKAWFWPRAAAGIVPDIIKNGSPNIDTSVLGTPSAFFPNTSCDIANKFGSHNIIINLSLCGDWAGEASVYSAAGCPSTCADFVNNNPKAFTNAYFNFASLRVYE